LTARKLDQSRFDACELCGGVAVDLLLSLQLWAAFSAAGEPLPAAVPAEVPVRARACASCAGPLEDFAYLESRDVILQRCGRCRWLWVPGDRQEGARRLWEKRTGREAQRMERKADLEAAYRPVVRRVGQGRFGTVHVGGDAVAQGDLIRAERERERDPK
jgi:hypothetical protein